MKQKQNHQISQLFLISLATAGSLFLIDIFISNRLSTNGGRIVSGVICALFATPLFMLGTIKSLKLNLNTWAAFNILAIVVIIGWTLWVSLILYAFKDFQLVLPN